ncbi:MAG TPA: GNAT family N-acetyltransferase [Bacillus sp. (in: firmicutes)]|nr:GNAT family N-acetyltransferase [Bacillus sp. (in: firmicutes)]
MATIRKAVIQDLPQLVEIYNQSVLNNTATFDLNPVTVEQRRKWFDLHDQNELYPLLVAERDGKVAGYASLSMFREKEAFQSTSEISIYIDRDHQGHGIGKQLMTAILELAKELNYHVIMAGITKGNDTSVKMHEKFGFQFCGELKEVGRKFGEWQSVLFYQLTFDN